MPVEPGLAPDQMAAAPRRDCAPGEPRCRRRQTGEPIDCRKVDRRRPRQSWRSGSSAPGRERPEATLATAAVLRGRFALRRSFRHGSRFLRAASGTGRTRRHPRTCVPIISDCAGAGRVGAEPSNAAGDVPPRGICGRERDGRLLGGGGPGDQKDRRQDGGGQLCVCHLSPCPVMRKRGRFRLRALRLCSGQAYLWACCGIFRTWPGLILSGSVS